MICLSKGSEAAYRHWLVDISGAGARRADANSGEARAANGVLCVSSSRTHELSCHEALASFCPLSESVL